MIFLASKWLKIDCVNNFFENYFERENEWEIIDKHITVFTVGIEISNREREREKTRPNKFKASTSNVTILKETIIHVCVRSSINLGLDFWLYLS